MPRKSAIVPAYIDGLELCEPCDVYFAPRPKTEGSSPQEVCSDTCRSRKYAQTHGRAASERSPDRRAFLDLTAAELYEVMVDMFPGRFAASPVRSARRESAHARALQKLDTAYTATTD